MGFLLEFIARYKYFYDVKIHIDGSLMGIDNVESLKRHKEKKMPLL
jgi:hypothetical protein